MCIMYVLICTLNARAVFYFSYFPIFFLFLVPPLIMLTNILVFFLPVLCHGTSRSFIFSPIMRDEHNCPT